MIQKIRIAKIKISEFEKSLSDIDPHWKSKNLFRWSYGGDNQTTLTSQDIYNLEGFRKRETGPLTFYDKGNQFIVEKINPPFTDVLTNIVPNEGKAKGIYNKNQKAIKVVMGVDKLLF